MSFHFLKTVFLHVPAAFLLASAVAQNTSPSLKQNVPTEKPGESAATRSAAQTKEASRRKFVLEVVQSAVALPQPDPQDRLRVLAAASNVISPIDSKMAKQFAKEGARIETELISTGQKPSVSMLASGQVDCASALSFVQTIPPAAVLDAEQSLIGAITNCQAQVSDAAKRKIEAGLQQGVVAARAILALMEQSGMKSQWSQTMFATLFASLPADAPKYADEAPHFAAMFTRSAPEMEKDAVKTAGLKLLLWLAKVPDGNERKVAVNMTTDLLSKFLGKDAYDELLRSDVLAQQVGATADSSAVLTPPEEESASVLRAMQNSDDRTTELQQMAPSLRAREAAASGFSSGVSGDRKTADHYFDIAFASLDEVWSSRASSSASAPDVVQEVSEAAAQVDPVQALQRTQRLQDPSAEAIGMLAVARVVIGSE